MAVFRIEKTRDYTVMSNHHLRNAGLSLKSKGLLSMMLSLPEDWNYTTRGLAKICKEGTDSIGSALKELERAGYIVRNRLRDSKGKIVDVEYVIYETPHPPDTGQPCEDAPDTACPDTENPDMDNPCLENRPQLNKEKRNPEEQNTDSSSTEGSNPIQSSPQPPAGAKRTGRDWMRERESYRELILENIEYDYLCRDDRLDRDMLNELVELKYEMLRKGSALKECYIVRYADDFKIFCRKRSDAVKLFAATRDWLKERLGLDISTEKSRIVNLKRQYSDFLGFKLRAVRKGVKSNGTAKYAVESHMNDKAVKKVKRQTREMVKRIQSPANVNEEYKAIGAYNAYVSGIHNYYRYATHISKDIHKIALGITRTMQNRLRERLQKQGNPLPAYIAERYGRSKQIRYVSGQAVIPIGYVQTKAPLYKRREVNQYTEQGRRSIHKNLESVNMSILHYLMRNPVQFASVELNNNRLALYCAQHGCCAVTKQPLEIGDIHCHHKLPREKGGNDQYGNLVLVTETVHILIHATDSEVIARLVQTLRLNTRQRAKLNTLRKIAGLFSI